MTCDTLMASPYAWRPFRILHTLNLLEVVFSLRTSIAGATLYNSGILWKVLGCWQLFRWDWQSPSPIPQDATSLTGLPSSWTQPRPRHKVSEESADSYGCSLARAYADSPALGRFHRVPHTTEMFLISSIQQTTKISTFISEWNIIQQGKGYQTPFFFSDRGMRTENLWLWNMGKLTCWAI